MKNKEQDLALQTAAEAHRDKHINHLAEEDTEAGTDTNNEESTENRRRRNDADSGNDGSSNEILQKESKIDPGNEHHHHTDANASGDGAGSTSSNPR